MSELFNITKTFIHSKLSEIINVHSIMIFIGIVFVILLVKLIINDNLD